MGLERGVRGQDVELMQYRTSEKYYHLCGSLSYIRLRSLDVYAADWCLFRRKKKRFREDFLFKYYQITMTCT